jgi:hypothetical protein
LPIPSERAPGEKKITGALRLKGPSYPGNIKCASSLLLLPSLSIMSKEKIGLSSRGTGTTYTVVVGLVGSIGCGADASVTVGHCCCLVFPVSPQHLFGLPHSSLVSE